MYSLSRAALAAAMMSAILPSCGQSEEASKPNLEARGGPAGGTTDPCGGTPRIETIAWGEQTELETSAKDAFAGLAGTCTAPFTWDASTLNDHVVMPRTASSEMTVTVTIDEKSARLVRPPEDAPTNCPPHLEVDTRVELETADGTFRETSKSTLVYGKLTGVRAMDFDRALGEQGGSLEVKLGKNETGTLSYALDGAGESCAGAIGMTLTTSNPGTNSGRASAEFIGQWSSTGCPIAETPVDLTAPRKGASSIADQLLEVWGDASYEGTWEDGKATTLRVQLAVSATTACQGQDGMSIPVKVTYGTADGRIVEHTTDANVNAGRDVDFGLWISDKLVCNDARDTLDYTRAMCAEVESVELQLGLNFYEGLGVEVAGGGVNVYATPRAGISDPMVQMLTLSNPK